MWYVKTNFHRAISSINFDWLLKNWDIAATNNTIHAAVAAWGWGAYLGEEAMAKGIRVKTSWFTHHHPNVTMCKAKASGNYTLSILAHQEVAQAGYDEAMLMDPQGYVCQGSGENVFLIKDGVLHTPDIAGGAFRWYYASNGDHHC